MNNSQPRTPMRQGPLYALAIDVCGCPPAREPEGNWEPGAGQTATGNCSSLQSMQAPAGSPGPASASVPPFLPCGPASAGQLVQGERRRGAHTEGRKEPRWIQWVGSIGHSVLLAYSFWGPGRPGRPKAERGSGIIASCIVASWSHSHIICPCCCTRTHNPRFPSLRSHPPHRRSSTLVDARVPTLPPSRPASCSHRTPPHNVGRPCLW